MRTHAKHAGTLAAATFLATMTIAGCSTDGTPVPDQREAMLGPERTSIVPANKNPLTSDQIPDPCNIPNNLVEKAKLLLPYADASDTNWWRFCRFFEGYTPRDGIFTTSTSLTSFQETVDAKENNNPSIIKIGDHTAIQYYYDTGRENLGCTIRWGTTYGTASVMYSIPRETPTDWDACVRTRQVATILAPGIPS